MYHGDPSRIQASLRAKAARVLLTLDSATSPEGMNVPGYRLHPLKGDLRGLWSVTIGGNWRILFRFEQGDAVNVDLVDYH